MNESENQSEVEKKNNPLTNDESTLTDDSDLQVPERHGFVTAWLIFTLISNSIVTLIYLFMVTSSAQISNIPKNMLIALVLTGLLNTMFSIMLLFWKKIAFYGLGITGILIFFINLNIGIPLIRMILGLAGFGLLYAILQIKKNGVSAWYYLK